MAMLNRIFIILMLLLIVTSCSKDEADAQIEIEGVLFASLNLGDVSFKSFKVERKFMIETEDTLYLILISDETKFEDIRIENNSAILKLGNIHRVRGIIVEPEPMEGIFTGIRIGNKPNIYIKATNIKDLKHTVTKD